MQHCEIAGMRDTLDRIKPGLLKWLLRNRNWEVKVRPIDPAAKVHPTVAERFGLPFVVQCAGSGPYRPPALAPHSQFKQYYPRVGAGSASGKPVEQNGSRTLV